MTSSLTPIITTELLQSIQGRDDWPKDVWYFVAATTLSELNRPEEIQTVYKHAIASLPGEDPAHDGQLRITRRIREALIKASAIGGLPKSINALHELRKATPEHLLDEPSGLSATGRQKDIYTSETQEVLQRGKTFFDKTYGKVAGRVRDQLNDSAEDLGLAVRLSYGYILSTTTVLSEAETSFVMMAGLIPQDVNPQLKGHLRGALNGGATVEQVRAVREVVISICSAAGMRMLEANVPGGWGWRTQVETL